MPRTASHAPGGMIYHVLNRGNARDRIFDKMADYAAFEQVLLETQEQVFVRILSYCLMPNHWHLVLWPLFFTPIPTKHSIDRVARSELNLANR